MKRSFTIKAWITFNLSLLLIQILETSPIYFVAKEVPSWHQTESSSFLYSSLPHYFKALGLEISSIFFSGNFVNLLNSSNLKVASFTIITIVILCSPAIIPSKRSIKVKYFYCLTFYLLILFGSEFVAKFATSMDSLDQIQVNDITHKYDIWSIFSKLFIFAFFINAIFELKNKKVFKFFVFSLSLGIFFTSSLYSSIKNNFFYGNQINIYSWRNYPVQGIPHESKYCNLVYHSVFYCHKLRPLLQNIENNDTFPELKGNGSFLFNLVYNENGFPLGGIEIDENYQEKWIENKYKVEKIAIPYIKPKINENYELFSTIRMKDDDIYGFMVRLNPNQNLNLNLKITLSHGQEVLKSHSAQITKENREVFIQFKLENKINYNQIKNLRLSLNQSVPIPITNNQIAVEWYGE